MYEIKQLPDSMMPDLILLNGNVITVDSKFSIAQAVAVKDDRIVAVGKSNDLNSLAGKKTRIINLRGATLMPGINDSHCHISDWALIRPPLQLETRYPIVKSIKDIVNMIADKASTLKPGEWIIGEGWDEGYLEECLADPNRKPVLGDLDNVSPNNPVVLTEYSGHRSWVNSLALKMAGITCVTPDPVGGKIGKKDTGELDGLLYEKASMGVRALVPPPTYTQRKKAIISAMAELNSLGITSFTDAGVDREKWACYNDVFNESYKHGEWACRVNMLLMMGGLGKLTVNGLTDAFHHIGARYNFGNDWLKIAGVKLIGDGIPPIETAYMYQPYLDGTYGFLVTEGNSPEEQEKTLRELIKLAHSNRMQVGIHSCGERTIDIIVDQYMRCIDNDPWDARHYVIHSDFTLHETIQKVKDFNRHSSNEIAFNVQSPIKWTISDHMETVVGPERAGYQWPLKSMLDAGIHVGNSSDAPVIYPDWRPGVKGAVLRESKATDKKSGPEQCISVKEAIATYTIHNAWLDHKDDIKGSIEEGKLADFCILDSDPLSIDPHLIVDLNIIMTIVGGRVVYDSGDL